MGVKSSRLGLRIRGKDTEVLHGVNRDSPYPDLKVKVVAGGVAGAAHFRYLLPFIHFLSGVDKKPETMSVKGGKTVAVINDNTFAVALPAAGLYAPT